MNIWKPAKLAMAMTAALLLCAVRAEGASLSIYYNDGGSSYTHKSFATGTSGNSLQGTGLIGTASDAGDRWILDIAGGNLNGRITTTSAVDIYLNGNTVVLSNTKSGYAIRGGNGVRVVGPGVLHIDQWDSSTAVSSAKTITFSLGAVVGINNLDEGTAVSGNGIRIIGAAVHVNAVDGYAFNSESDGFTISSSIVSAISTKECVRLRSHGPLTVSASSVHLLSTASSAIRSGSDIFTGGESVLVSSSVFCAAGSEHGIKFHDNAALLSFDNVIGAVLGRKCGVADARTLLIDGGATKLVFAGNTKGEYSAGELDAVSLLEDDASSGQAIWMPGSRSYFELDAGSVKLFAPRNVGLSVATNVVAGGSLRVESNPTYGDFQDFFTAAGIVSAAETVAGGLAFGSDILFADIDLAQALSSVCTAGDALFGTDGSKTSVGLSQRALFVRDGSVFVSSGGTGISMGKNSWDYGYRDEAIYYQSAGSVVIESDGLALADLGAIEGNTSFKEDESLFLLTGGQLSAKGRLDGILTCGGLLMKGGTLEAAATGGFAAETISSAPGLRGYALSANNGFVIEGGSFVATAGKVLTPPYMSSEGGQDGGREPDVDGDPPPPQDDLSFGVGEVSTFTVPNAGTAVLVGASGVTWSDFSDTDYYGIKTFVNENIVDCEKTAADDGDENWCYQMSDIDAIFLTGWATKTSYATVDDMKEDFSDEAYWFGNDDYWGDLFDWYRDMTGIDLVRGGYVTDGTITDAFLTSLRELMDDGGHVVRINVLLSDILYNPRLKNENLPWGASHGVLCVGYMADGNTLKGLFLVDTDNDQYSGPGGRFAPNSVVYCPVSWDGSQFNITGIWGQDGVVESRYRALAKMESSPQPEPTPDPTPEPTPEPSPEPTPKVTTYTVAFNANGGTGPETSQPITSGESTALWANSFGKSGYVFIGWAMSADGPVAYVDQQAVADLAPAGGSVTLYAQWAKKSYKVKFYANGGKGKMATLAMTYGKSKKLTVNKFKRDGYTFKGWATSKKLAKKGKVAYKNKKKVKNLVTNGKTVKLYAVWKKR